MRVPSPSATACIFLSALALAGQAPSRATVDLPTYNPPGGLVRSPALVQITHGNESGTIFYTIDGSDPRDPLGLVAPEARSLAGPLSINRSMTIRARVRRGAEWSDLAVAAFTADQDFSKLFFSELMYHPTDSGDVHEFVEFKNIGPVPLDLSGLSFGLRDLANAFTFRPGSRIEPGGFCVLVAAADAFRIIHPSVPFLGEYEATLDNFSDDLRLHRDGAVAARVVYETYPPWQVIPDNHGYFPSDGVGFSLVRSTFDPASDPTDHRPWRASKQRFGSPGADDPPSTIPAVQVNELLTRTSAGVLDFVELYNPNAFPVDLAGWWLSDERDYPYRHKFPAGTVVPPLGYLVVDEAQFGASVGFNAAGDGCYIFSGDVEGNLTGYSHGFEYAAAERDVSFGRHLASDGTESFPSQLSRTPGTANSGPRPSPIVISEILYHPDFPQGAYIELQNATAASVNLWDPANPAITWAIGTHREYQLPLPGDITLPPGGHLLVVAGDPQVIRTTYAVPDAVPIVRLANFFNYLPPVTKVFLSKPVGLNGTPTPYHTSEFVQYGKSRPWPAGADTAGYSLERLKPAAFPNDPHSWRESPAVRSPGLPSSENLPPRAWAGGDQTHFTGREGTLRGAVADDRWIGDSPTSSWTQLSGPAAAEFSAPALESVNVRFPEAGQYVVRLLASDGFESRSDTATITVIDRPFDGWRTASFTADELADDTINHPLADPDGDLLPNLGEYVFASPPKIPGSSTPLRFAVSGERLEATWIQRTSLPDVVITPERADRVEGPWHAGWEFFDRAETPIDGNVEITIREKLPVASRTRGFIRLRYSLR